MMPTTAAQADRPMESSGREAGTFMVYVVMQLALGRTESKPEGDQHAFRPKGPEVGYAQPPNSLCRGNSLLVDYSIDCILLNPPRHKRGAITGPEMILNITSSL